MRILSLLLFALPTLENTHWRLVELDGKPQASPPGTRQIYIRLNATAKRFEGFAGCNTVSGGFLMKENSLKFNDIMSTMMACPSLDIEKQFTRALSATSTYQVTAEGLALLSENGKTVARFAGEDPWQKVAALAAGTEVRFVKKNAPGKPVTAIFDSAENERMIVVVKNEQIAVPKDEIGTLEARPKQAGSRMTTSSNTTQNMPMDRPPAANPAERMKPAPPNSTSSSSSGVSFGGKPGFELIYRAR